MFDFLRNKFEKSMTYSKEKENQIRDDIFNILIEAEVNYELAEKISYRVIEHMNNNLEYKKALQKTIKENINSSHGQLKKGIILLMGFQGHGKTTSSHKLANFLQKQNFKVVVTSLDEYRTAALIQLKENLTRFNIPFLTLEANNIEEKCNYIRAQEKNYDYIIVDTAGINYLEESTKSNELTNIEKLLKPQETIMVINTLLGHSLFKILENFKNKIKITGAIMTNVDGDKKGGGFLSFYYMMKVPIFYISNGEQIQNFEKFNEDSITNILLGELDLEGLESIIKQNVSQSIEQIFMNEVIQKGIFTLEYFLIFTNATSTIGLGRVAMGLGLSGEKFKDNKHNQENIKTIRNVIGSMTKKEKQNKVNINSSRIKRISIGSGIPIHIIEQVLMSYEKTKNHMLQLSKMLKSGNNQDIGKMINMLKDLIGKEN